MADKNLTSVSIFRPLMIVTQKITALAFQLHDGESLSLQLLNEGNSSKKIAAYCLVFSGMCKKPDQLTPEQKLLAIK